jgi:hypothetical protein
MFKFISLSYPKAYYRPDHPIRVAEYHRKKLLSLNSKTFFFTKASIVITFKDTLSGFCQFLPYEHRAIRPVTPRVNCAIIVKF